MGQETRGRTTQGHDERLAVAGKFSILPYFYLFFP